MPRECSMLGCVRVGYQGVAGERGANGSMSDVSILGQICWLGPMFSDTG